MHGEYQEEDDSESIKFSEEEETDAPATNAGIDEKDEDESDNVLRTPTRYTDSFNESKPGDWRCKDCGFKKVTRKEKRGKCHKVGGRPRR